MVYSQNTNNIFGKMPPENLPEIFAEGILSFGYHEHNMAISKNGEELFFTLSDVENTTMMIMTSVLFQNNWSIPTVAKFSNSGNDIHPVFSPDGNKLFFASTRPINKKDTIKDLNIWYVKRVGDSWSEPISAGSNINSDLHESSPAFSKNGTIYFDVKVDNPSGNWDIYKSKFQNGEFQKREKVKFLATKKNKELGPFISPDDSYILFYSNRPDSYGEADLYVSFRDKNNNFQAPVNLGKNINSQYYDWSPFVSPDGNFLIFSSYRNTETINSNYPDYSDFLISKFGKPKPCNGTFYWIDTKIINNLKNEK